MTSFSWWDLVFYYEIEFDNNQSIWDAGAAVIQFTKLSLVGHWVLTIIRSLEMQSQVKKVSSTKIREDKFDGKPCSYYILIIEKKENDKTKLIMLILIKGFLLRKTVPDGGGRRFLRKNLEVKVLIIMFILCYDWSSSFPTFKFIENVCRNFYGPLVVLNLPCWIIKWVEHFRSWWEIW